MIQEILETIGRSSFRIIGYKASDGCTYNITVHRLRPGDTYTHLVSRSLAEIDSIDCPTDTDPVVWDEVLDKQRISFLKHLDAPGRREMLSGSEFHPSECYQKIGDDIEDGVEIHGVLCDMDVIDGEPKKPVSADAVARAKLRALLPVGRYVGKLILTPGKFKEVAPCD